MIPNQFFAATDLCVVGSNPEMADITNPQGNVYGFAAYVYAESEQGDRCRVFVKASRVESEVLPQAERMASALNVRLAKGKLPIAFENWEETRPGYGSAAYIAYGQANDFALESMEG